jgi:hypothetical protein
MLTESSKSDALSARRRFNTVQSSVMNRASETGSFRNTSDLPSPVCFTPWSRLKPGHGIQPFSRSLHQTVSETYRTDFATASAGAHPEKRYSVRSTPAAGSSGFGCQDDGCDENRCLLSTTVKLWGDDSRNCQQCLPIQSPTRHVAASRPFQSCAEHRTTTLRQKRRSRRRASERIRTAKAPIAKYQSRFPPT